MTSAGRPCDPAGRRKLLAARILAVVPLAVAVAAAGAPQEPVPEGLFGETVDVHVVGVEVHVLDRRGEPVTGLGREDFLVRLDGEPVPISNFYAADGGLRKPRGHGNGTRGPAPPAVAPSAAERRLSLVLFVDQSSLSPGHRNRALDRVEEIAGARLDRGDRVLVATYDGRVKIVSPFTDDPGRLRAALDTVRREAGSRMALDATRRFILRRLETADADDALSILNDIQVYAGEIADRNRRALRVLQAFVGSLAGQPGRKVIVHLSEGVEVRPGEDLFTSWSYRFGGSGFEARREALVNDLTPAIKALVRDANAAGVTFYTLDLAGSRSMSSLSAEVSGLNADGDVRLQTPETDALLEAGLQESIAELAVDTGGAAILHANRPEAVLAELVPRLDMYYSLGVVPPPDKRDGYHRIEVEVRRPEVTVRHRRGYRFKPAAERLEERTLAALLLAERSNPLRVLVEVGEAERGSKKRRLLPVRIRVPLGRVELIPGREEHRGRLAVKIAVSHGDGELAVAEQREIPLAVPAARLGAARRQYYTASFEIPLERGLHRLAVGVADVVGGAASFVTQDVYLEE